VVAIRTFYLGVRLRDIISHATLEAVSDETDQSGIRAQVSRHANLLSSERRMG
jgi:hypothetical protein